WDGLTRFIADGRVEIDSNVVERAIRPIALNRENALFAGSDGGGEHWAVIASLIETCKLIGVEPHAYLADVITRIVNDHPNSQSTNCYPGPISLPKNAGAWPENIAYKATLRTTSSPPRPCTAGNEGMKVLVTTICTFVDEAVPSTVLHHICLAQVVIQLEPSHRSPGGQSDLPDCIARSLYRRRPLGVAEARRLARSF
ncbi:hypothetical protein ABID65_009580, partial [Bradyrhizobium sp. S3.9.2]